MNASAENMKGRDLREIMQVFVFLTFEIETISNYLLGAVPQEYLLLVRNPLKLLNRGGDLLDR